MTIRTKANTESFVMEILKPLAGISSYKSLVWSSEKPADINTRFVFIGVFLTKITSLSVVLYGFETWSLTSREELVFRVSGLRISWRLPESLPSSEMQARFRRNLSYPSSRTTIKTGIKIHPKRW